MCVCVASSVLVLRSSCAMEKGIGLLVVAAGAANGRRFPNKHPHENALHASTISAGAQDSKHVYYIYGSLYAREYQRKSRVELCVFTSQTLSCVVTLLSRAKLEYIVVEFLRRFSYE